MQKLADSVLAVRWFNCCCAVKAGVLPESGATSEAHLNSNLLVMVHQLFPSPMPFSVGSLTNASIVPYLHMGSLRLSVMLRAF